MGVSVKTTKKLFALSGNQCMFNNCREMMYEKNEDAIIGEICHIRSPKPNGPRHIKDYQAVDSIDNLMLLCPKHHKIIDQNVEKYNVQVLVNMKARHQTLVTTFNEASDDLARRIIFKSESTLNIENSTFRDVFNINIQDPQGNINFGNIGSKSNETQSRDVVESKSNHAGNTTFCSNCGATPGQKSVCTGLSAYHDFVNS